MKFFRIAFAFAIPASLGAHAGETFQPHDLWTAWRFDTGVVIPLVMSAALYARGARRSRGVKRWQAACFWSGLAVLAIALISPLHPLGEALFSAHMAQHELLMLAAAPLLVLSRPLAPMVWALPFEWRRTTGRWSGLRPVRSVWRAITAPASAWTIHGAAIWLWHAPPLFEATLTHEWVHAAQHASFFGSALLFWWALLHARGAVNYGSSVLYLFTTAIHTSILGALLTFGRTLWYPVYQATAPAWGLPALEDQQLGGLIMWVPGGLVYLAASLVLLAAWLRESEAVAGRRRYAS